MLARLGPTVYRCNLLGLIIPDKHSGRIIQRCSYDLVTDCGTEEERLYHVCDE